MQLPRCLDLCWNMQDESEHLCSFGHSSARHMMSRDLLSQSAPPCDWPCVDPGRGSSISACKMFSVRSLKPVSLTKSHVRFQVIVVWTYPLFLSITLLFEALLSIGQASGHMADDPTIVGLWELLV